MAIYNKDLTPELKKQLGLPPDFELGPNEYLGEPEDLDALGIPRSHTVVSASPKPKPSKTEAEPPEADSGDLK